MAGTANGESGLLPGSERRAGALFCERRPASVCAYDARRVPATAPLGIVDAHPIVVYALGGCDEPRHDPAMLEPLGHDGDDGPVLR